MRNRGGWMFVCVALTSTIGCDALREVQTAAQGEPERKQPVLRRDSDDDDDAEHTAPLKPVPAPPVAATPQEPPWREILGPAQAVVPPPAVNLTWLDDLPSARSTAEAEGRPLLVVLRCEQSQQFAEFDAAVQQSDFELQRLLRQFVTVRLTNADALDLHLLPAGDYQDLDVSWWCWLLSDAGVVYSVYGGRDHLSESGRVSIASFKRTLERVLDHHYDPRRLSWNAAGPLPPDGALAPQQLPGYASWLAKAQHGLAVDCLRCHHVAEIHRQPSVDAKRVDKRHELSPWPYPESIGVRLDHDDGLIVTEIAPNSPATELRLLPGDVLGAAGTRRLFSEADLRGVLHRLPANQTRLVLYWLRDGRLMSGELSDLRGNWRITDASWRPSIVYGQIGAVPGFFPAPANAALRRRFELAPDRLAVVPQLDATSPAFQAGLRPTDIVYQIDVPTSAENIPTRLFPDLSGLPFIVWFRRSIEPHREITVHAVSTRTGGRRTVTYTAPAYEPPNPAADAEHVPKAEPAKRGRRNR